MTGVILGVVSATQITFGTSPSDQKQNATANALRKASVAIFLVLTVFQAILTFVLAREMRSIQKSTPNTNEQWDYTMPLEPNSNLNPNGSRRASGQNISAFWVRQGSWALFEVSFLLIIREVYAVATVGHLKVNEAVWYPLTALTELIAVALYATPGLVPHAR